MELQHYWEMDVSRHTVLASRSQTLKIAVSLLVGGAITACSSGFTTPVGSTQQATVTVSGASQVRLGAAVQFTASVSNAANTAVSWNVNGIAGGNATSGTISTNGLYTPPATLPPSNTVTIAAVSNASPTISGSMTESILNPVPAISNASATLTSGTSYLLDVEGTGFVGGSQIDVSGQAVTTTFASGTELQANITVPSGTATVGLTVVNPDPGSTTSAQASTNVLQLTLTAAARLLDQSSFGPTLSGIANVQQLGLNGYLAQQFNTPPTLLPDIPASPLPAVCLNLGSAAPCEESEWWQAALTGNDQLRQRVAFALSEQFVISSLFVNAQTITYYHNTLAKDAFGNFYDIMHDVSLSPGMGAYLNMVNSITAPAGQIANENYARELMQLFTIGLVMLNADGTPQLDSNGNTIPTYTQDQVQAFARAYTGWTYAASTGGAPKSLNYTANYFAPMAPVESYHDMSSKILLNGTVLPAGQSAEQDLQGALTNIFNHPNVGPFVCKQLIQHLVTSTPSPAYVARVAAVFANNGEGVRGDMQAVITAILTDSEARAGDTDPAVDGGHLREPVLWIANFIRALGFTNTDPNGSYYPLSIYSATLNQQPYRSGSVFNFFPPNYVIPGTQLTAPEFDLENTGSVIARLWLVDSLVFDKITGFNVDLSASSPLGTIAAKSPGDLVDTLGMMFMHGQMPAQMRTEIVNSISGLSDISQRVRVAVYLVITASQYKVMN